MKLTIYHNPGCSKSRQALALLTERGLEPKIVEYLREPPDEQTTLRLAQLLGIPVIEMLRPNEAHFAALTETAAAHDDAALARNLAQYPQALQRPIVVDEDTERAVIGRPPETVLDLIQPGTDDD